MMIVPAEDEDEQNTWIIDQQYLLRVSRRLEDSTRDSAHTRFDLWRMIAHEAFHIHDIFFEPERAAKAGELNKRGEITNFGEGEREPEEFGRHYADFKMKQLEAT